MAEAPIIDPEKILAYKFPELVRSYTEKDVVLYNLGIGACSTDALDTNELKYAYHPDGQKSVQVLPTFAAVFSIGILSQRPIPGLHYDPRLLLHGQQYIEIYKPLPTNASIQSKVCISGLHDKGKATVLEIELVTYDKESGEPLCMNRMAAFLRGAGGFSKSSPPYSYSKNPTLKNLAAKIPESKPFAVHEERTHPSQALLYRLSGDYNPLHSDPKIAETAGFSRPILHGLCTLGFAVRAIIKCICRGDPNSIKTISNRFLLHVYPGETLITEMWLQGLRVVFQVKVKERNRVVLSGFVDISHLSSSL